MLTIEYDNFSFSHYYEIKGKRNMKTGFFLQSYEGLRTYLVQVMVKAYSPPLSLLEPSLLVMVKTYINLINFLCFISN